MVSTIASSSSTYWFGIGKANFPLSHWKLQYDFNGKWSCNESGALQGQTSVAAQVLYSVVHLQEANQHCVGFVALLRDQALQCQESVHYLVKTKQAWEEECFEAAACRISATTCCAACWEDFEEVDARPENCSRSAAIFSGLALATNDIDWSWPADTSSPEGRIILALEVPVVVFWYSFSGKSNGEDSSSVIKFMSSVLRKFGSSKLELRTLAREVTSSSSVAHPLSSFAASRFRDCVIFGVSGMMQVWTRLAGGVIWRIGRVATGLSRLYLGVLLISSRGRIVWQNDQWTFCLWLWLRWIVLEQLLFRCVYSCERFWRYGNVHPIAAGAAVGSLQL